MSSGCCGCEPPWEPQRGPRALRVRPAMSTSGPDPCGGSWTASHHSVPSPRPGSCATWTTRSTTPAWSCSLKSASSRCCSPATPRSRTGGIGAGRVGSLGKALELTLRRTARRRSTISSPPPTRSNPRRRGPSRRRERARVASATSRSSRPGHRSGTGAGAPTRYRAACSPRTRAGRVRVRGSDDCEVRVGADARRVGSHQAPVGSFD